MSLTPEQRAEFKRLVMKDRELTPGEQATYQKLVLLTLENAHKRARSLSADLREGQAAEGTDYYKKLHEENN